MHIIDYIHKRQRQRTNRECISDKRWDAVEADRSVKFCTKCNRSYEAVRRVDGLNRVIQIYLDDFPSWGKEKLNCSECV